MTTELETRADAIASRVRKFVFDAPDYRHCAWVTIFAVAAIDWIWARRDGLTIAGVLPPVAAIAFLAAVGAIYGTTRRNMKLADLGHYTALWFALAVAVNLYSYMVATLRLPMRDADFARMDAALGFDWAACIKALEPHHGFQYLLGYAYNSFPVQIIFSIALFAFSGRRDRNREMLWIGLFGALIATSVSGLLPALGPYLDDSIPSWSAVLLAIRNGSLTIFTIAEMQGIVSFPSFHTVLALMLIYVHRPPSWTFVPIAILNALMLTAIPFAGHHYIVDVIAGVAVTALCIWIVRLMDDESTRRE
ncbi:MAG TPA: phosphatase PAP2 family protein [Candidatus Acidoferrales bacterium]|nr:phosphatase PAP2 family protein [Candidatus Acidoferrales bacterium]